MQESVSYPQLSELETRHFEKFQIIPEFDDNVSFQCFVFSIVFTY